MAQAAKRSLELSARHAETVKSAIQHWAASGTLSPSQASLLADTIVAQGFDWEKFAKYTLRLAVLCLVVAISSVIFEEWFVRIFKRLVALPPWLRSALTGLIAVGVHYFAHQRTQSLPGQKYANEAVHGIGALLFALAAFQLLEQLKHSFDFAAKSDGESTKEQEDDEKRHEKKKRERLRNNAVQGVTLGLGTIYGSIGVLSRSNFIWSCSMIVLGNFCGGMVGYGSGTYWLGMDLPLLFTSLGSFLIGAAFLMRSNATTAPLWSTTRIWGLLYFFISLWIMSIWGSDGYSRGSGRSWFMSRAAHVVLWSMIFLVAAGVSIWHGLRYDDSTTKSFGLTFLGLNLYTKFFEWGWGWSKPLFFATLAGSLAVVGRYAENVWNMKVGAI